MFINQILTKLKSLVYSKSETDSLLNGKASSSHTHTKSQITDFPTIPSKTSQLTNDSEFLTSEIDSMGEGWVRFKCGLQICWGVSNVIQCGQRETKRFAVSYNAFESNPVFSLTRNGGKNGWAQIQCSVTSLTTTYANVSVFNNNNENVSSQTQYLWQAIGYWK